MRINPTFLTVGELFGRPCMFVVPKYQRSFSWSESEIIDFWSDIESCYFDSINQRESSHFFGGLVFVKYPVEKISMSRYELIDGQQRMASFVILVSCLHSWLKEISETQPERKEEAEAVMDRTKKYLEWSETIDRQRQGGIKLTLTKRDQEFFEKLISDEGSPAITSERESNKRLSAAYSLLNTKIREQEQAKAFDVLERIDKLIEVLETRCKVLQLETENKNDAYRLFQVLNDRGMSLTEGDLLRATTLEFFDKPEYKKEQEEIEVAWDNILKDAPRETQDYLDWYFASFVGRAAKRSQRFDDYVDQFFKVNNSKKITSEEAKKVMDRVKCLNTQVEKLRKLSVGSWPYSSKSSKVTNWDKERLSLLIEELKHTQSMPLLLAASVLKEKQFFELVHILEKFFFRYKVICNGHAGAFTSTYYNEAITIRQTVAEGNSYSTKDLIKNLRKLIVEKAGDEKFGDELVRELKYKNPRSNKKVKYFLTTLEHFAFSKRSGNKSPAAKNIVIDFDSTSLEHIYPQTPTTKGQDKELDKVVNDLGNLTIIDSPGNSFLRNKPFSEKRQDLKESKIVMNQKIGSKKKWTIKEVKERERVLIEYALKVFNLT